MIKYVVLLTGLLHFLWGFVLLTFEHGNASSSDTLPKVYGSSLGLVMCMLAVMFTYLYVRFDYSKIDKRFCLYVLIYGMLTATHAFYHSSLPFNNLLGISFATGSVLMTLAFILEKKKFI